MSDHCTQLPTLLVRKCLALRIRQLLLSFGSINYSVVAVYMVIWKSGTGISSTTLYRPKTTQYVIGSFQMYLTKLLYIHFILVEHNTHVIHMIQASLYKRRKRERCICRNISISCQHSLLKNEKYHYILIKLSWWEQKYFRAYEILLIICIDIKLIYVSLMCSFYDKEWNIGNTYAIDNDLENWKECKIWFISCADVIEDGNL